MPRKQLTLGLTRLTRVDAKERARVLDRLRARGLRVELRGRGKPGLFVTLDERGAVVVRASGVTYLGTVSVPAREELAEWLGL